MTNLLDEALRLHREVKVVPLAENSRASIDAQIGTWRKWMQREVGGGTIYLSDVDTVTMARYFNYLRPRVAANTFNRYRQIIDSFWKYCVAEAWVPTNPVRDVKRQTVDLEPRLQLSTREWGALLEAAVNPRDRILFAIALNTGLRCCDVVALRVGNVDLDSLTIFTKIQKTHGADGKPITKQLYNEMIRWYEYYADHMKLPNIESIPDTWRLVPAYQGHGITHPPTLKPTAPKPMTHAGLKVKVALEKIGRDSSKEGMHTLRRTAGRRFMDLALAHNEPDPMGAVQAMYDHKLRANTERYLGLTADRLRRDKLLRGQPFIETLEEIDEARIAEMTSDIPAPESRLRRA